MACDHPLPIIVAIYTHVAIHTTVTTVTTVAA